MRDKSEINKHLTTTKQPNVGISPKLLGMYYTNSKRTGKMFIGTVGDMG